MADEQPPLTAALEEALEYAAETNSQLQACKPRMLQSLAAVESGSYTPEVATKDLTEGWAHGMVALAGWFAKTLDILAIAGSEVPPPAVFDADLKAPAAQLPRPSTVLAQDIGLFGFPNSPPIRAEWVSIDPATLVANANLPSVTVRAPAAHPRGRYVGELPVMHNGNNVGAIAIQVTLS